MLYLLALGCNPIQNDSPTVGEEKALGTCAAETLCRGDVNGDAVVNMVDMSLFRGAYLSGGGGECTDFDFDGSTTLDDAAILKDWFNAAALPACPDRPVDTGDDGGPVDTGDTGDAPDTDDTGDTGDTPDTDPMPADAPAIIANLAPGEWAEVPNSTLEGSGVMPSPIPGSGAEYVMSAWNGGAFDSKRNRLLVWGGGHFNYYGNEVYAFDLPSLSWIRLTDTTLSADQSSASAYYPDGSPRARHTYNYLEYLPATDEFCSFGGAAYYYDSGTSGHIDCLDLETLEWEYKDMTTSTGYGTTCAVDPRDSNAYCRGYYTGSLVSQYDPTTESVDAITSLESDRYILYPDMVVDPDSGTLMMFGGGSQYAWDIDGSAERTTLSTSGPQNVVSDDDAAVEYDESEGLMVGWTGGTSVYVLDPTTMAWSEREAAASNTVTPSAESTGGTYGRFQYIPDYDAYVLVNATNTSVYVYRLAE